MNNYLNKLLYPLEQSEFLDHYQNNRPFVVHHEENQLEVLRNLPQLKSLESLLSNWPSPVSAHLLDAKDEVSSVDVNSKDAIKLFKNGMGLLFNNANEFCPILKQWVEGIQKDLGLSALTYGRSLIYATPKEGGTAAHFDQNINFVLQIQGVKEWTLAPNESVIHPTRRHTIGSPVDAELMSYIEEEMPQEMPKDTISFELRPGSLLFVPRGVWHKTHATEEALALNFTFTAPTWADLFLTALRSRLIGAPFWRETADGVRDPHRRFQSEKKFDYLLSTLKEDLPFWRAEDILNVTEPDSE